MAAGARQEDPGEFRLPPPQRPVRAVPRPARHLHQSPRRRKLPGRAAPHRTPLSSQRQSHYGVEGCTNPSSSNNLGIHARSRAAAYAAADFRALRRFSLSLAAREEVYRNFSGEFSPTIAGGVWVNPQLEVPRVRQPRFSRAQLYRAILFRPDRLRQSPTCARSAPGPTKPASTGSPAPACAAESTVFDRHVRDGIDYYRTALDAPW